MPACTCDNTKSAGDVVGVAILACGQRILRNRFFALKELGRVYSNVSSGMPSLLQLLRQLFCQPNVLILSALVAAAQHDVRRCLDPPYVDVLNFTAADTAVTGRT